MNYPDPSAISSEPDPSQAYAGSARARRRRARRLIVPQDAEGQSTLLSSLARRAYPSYELFIFAALCGALLGLGYLLDSQAILLLGVLLAPLMTPWVGMLLALITGSARFLFETFMALLISALLVFLTGLMTGFAARLFLPRTFNTLYVHSRMWIPELIVLGVGAVLLVVSFVRSEARPFLPSVVVAYALFPPVSAAGFGLGSGVDGIWPEGALVFLAHFALVGLIGLVTLVALKLRPSTGGMFFSGAAVIAAVTAMVILMGSGVAQAAGRAAAAPAPAELVEAALASPATEQVSALALTPSPSPSPTPRIQTVTAVPLTLAVTLPVTETPTVTLTIQPTPVLARILAHEGGGATLRETPGGAGITTLDNYTIVEVLPETEEVSGWTWSHIIADQNGVKREGWVLQILLDVATPVPNWEPSSTPSATPAEQTEIP